MVPAFSPRSDGARPVINLIRQARQGVLRSRVDEVAAQVGLTDMEMARVLNMSVRSLHGKTGSDTLSLASSERLLLLERLILHGLAVFDGRADLLSHWLRTPLAELSYREGPELPLSSFSILEAGSFAEPEPVYQTKADPTPGTLVPQSPLAVLDTVMGFSLVEDVLARIEWGIAG